MCSRGVGGGGAKRPGNEAYHSNPTSTEVKQTMSNASIPPIRLHVNVQALNWNPLHAGLLLASISTLKMSEVVPPKHRLTFRRLHEVFQEA
jgi:hypothetical protein